MEQKDQAAAIGQWRLMLVQAAAALGALAALTYTARTYAMSRHGQLTERFTQAIERLGAETEPYLWIGGIRALELVSYESPRHHDSVVEMLSDFVRDQQGGQHQPIPQPLLLTTPPPGRSRIPPKVQAALNTIGRRRRPRRNRLNLSGLDLCDAILKGVELRRANLSNCLLRRSYLSYARLQHAIFPQAQLHYADLTKARLCWADMNGARLPHAALFKARIQHAVLNRARLQRADMRRCHAWFADLSEARLSRANLTQAKLWGADLSSSHLDEADLTKAKLWFADLRSVDLTNTKGVTPFQLFLARTDRTTSLPPGLVRRGLFIRTVRSVR